METKSSVVLAGGGEIKLPVGFRFHPTDEELLAHYLKRKALSVPLPALVIPELDVLETDPRGLPGDSKERRHFFARRAGRRNPNLRRRGSTRAAIRDGFGYWKRSGREKRIVASGSDQVIGMKRTLVFCEGKDFDRMKPRWVMHELCLLGTQAASYSTRFRSETIPPALDKGEGEWAVYRVLQKRRKQHDPRKPRGVIGLDTLTVIDFRNEVEDLIGIGSESDPHPLPPSPSSSSGSMYD